MSELVNIKVEDLRVGMYVHLSLGWMSHPFPVSNFKITSEQQLTIIRSLGVATVRWCQERSDKPDDGTAAGDAGVTPATGAAAQPTPAELAAQAIAAAAQSEKRRLQDQHAKLQLCERQYSEARVDLRRINDHVADQPTAARDGAIKLTQALLDKMLVEGELSVRVLNDANGDHYSMHALNVSLVSLLLGRAVGLERDILLDMGTAALMHDVGKLDLPDRVRQARADFTSAEAALYREHVARGVTQARRMGLSAPAQLMVAQHHEHADGSGFPMAMHYDHRVSQAARIVALVNHYDNLCNGPVPALALTPHEALSQMFSQCRHKFDPGMLGAFIRMMGIYPPGSVVQLTDQRYAMVMSVNAERPLKPCVLLADPKVSPDDALHVDLGECGDLGIQRSLKPAQLPQRAMAALAPRRRLAYFFDVEKASVTQAAVGAAA